MSELIASAPGKLVLVGEYAVLEGAPALALAVDRRARVRLLPRSDGLCLVRAPQVGVAQARLRLGPRGELLCPDEDMARRLQLVRGVWDALAGEGLLPDLRAGFELELDTSGFVHDSAAGRSKLGLGSSAALCVALAAALLRASGHEALLRDRAALLARLIDLHRNWQGGQGSGIDLAASQHGGLILFQREPAPGAPRVRPVCWPKAGLHGQFIGSGQPVSTADQLQRLAAWRAREPAIHARRMAELGERSAAAVAALDRPASGFLAALAGYADALAAFAQDSGLEIFSPAQQRLMQRARRLGAVFKPCGAGGEIGWLLAQDPEQLEMLHRSMMSDGLHPLALAPDPRGLHFEFPQARA